MLRRLIKASAIVIGVGLVVTGCAVTPVKMGSAAIVGNERISIATLDTEVTNLSQAAKKYPGVVSLTATQQTQATLTWLIRYQINEEMARQAGITVSPAQAQEALNQAVASAESAAKQQGLTNVTQDADPGRQRDPAEHLDPARPVRGDRQRVPEDRQRRHRAHLVLGPDSGRQQAQQGRMPGGQGAEHPGQPAVRAAGLQPAPGGLGT